uniref:protein-tyrosine-phosphatase n=1 Tax=viral metagenome TaxID=1070528 RepID=A0A6C0M0Y6_9ZZZZ
MEPIEVVPNLWAGGIEYASNSQFLLHNGIKHVLSLCYDDTADVVSIDHKRVRITDDANENIYDVLDECVSYIDDAIQKNDPIYVHCVHGRCRTACIITAYLSKHNNISIHEAYSMLMKKYARAMILPVFFEQLQCYEHGTIYVHRQISYAVPRLVLPRITNRHRVS